VVSDKKIFKVSTNQNTLLALAAMLNFQSTPKDFKIFFPIQSESKLINGVAGKTTGHVILI
jgi:hypothetical protein